MLYYLSNYIADNGIIMHIRKPNRLLPARWDDVSVECYSGYKANERPVSFTFLEQRREIVEIVDQWYEGGVEAGRPEVNYFKVRTTEGDIFLLRYVSVSDSWSIRPHKDPAAIIGVC